MNNKVSKNLQILKKNDSTRTFSAIVIFMICGAVAGCIISLYTQHTPNLKFFQNDIFSVIENEIDAYSFGRTYFNLTKYPFIIFLLSFTVFGYMLIPLIISLKSFLLTFSISTILQLYGSKYFFLPLSLFGIQTFLSIPALLLIATLGVEVSKSFSFKSRKGKFNKKDKSIFKYILLFFTLMFSLLLFTFLDIALTPRLVSLSIK